MSKKKNTLKDLNEFLKQQAATLVSPPKLTTEKNEALTELKESPVMREIEPEVSFENVFSDIMKLSKDDSLQFRKKFYELIIKSTAALPRSLPEDKMLINTALYLKYGERWKEAIREYWRNKD
jgi:hypothetical protein